MRVRLTDQALVAVTAARSAAAATGRTVSVADLVLGLATVPEGVVGRQLAGTPAALATLAARVPSSSRRLPDSEVAIRWAAGEVTQRPLWTADLLLAALEVGAGDLADLLHACGLDPGLMRQDLPRPSSPPRSPVDHPEELTETFGLRDGGDLEPAAARAVARARAHGGAATVLLAALVLEAVMDPEAVPLDVDAVDARLRRLHDDDAAGDRSDDASLSTVVEAAGRVAAHPGALRPVDLLRALALTGGPTVSTLLSGTEER